MNIRPKIMDDNRQPVDWYSQLYHEFGAFERIWATFGTRPDNYYYYYYSGAFKMTFEILRSFASLAQTCRFVLDYYQVF